MGIPTPNYPKSRFIRAVHFDKTRIHKGDGDMWPLTWADDGHLYGAAGDNMGSPSGTAGTWTMPGMRRNWPCAAVFSRRDGRCWVFVGDCRFSMWRWAAHFSSMWRGTAVPAAGTGII